MSEIVLLSAGYFALHDGVAQKKIDVSRSYRDIKAKRYSAKFASSYSEDLFYAFQSLSLRFLRRSDRFYVNT